MSGHSTLYRQLIIFCLQKGRRVKRTGFFIFLCFFFLSFETCCNRFSVITVIGYVPIYGTRQEMTFGEVSEPDYRRQPLTTTMGLFRRRFSHYHRILVAVTEGGIVFEGTGSFVFTGVVLLFYCPVSTLSSRLNSCPDTKCQCRRRKYVTDLLRTRTGRISRTPFVLTILPSLCLASSPRWYGSPSKEQNSFSLCERPLKTLMNPPYTRNVLPIQDTLRTLPCSVTLRSIITITLE